MEGTPTRPYDLYTQELVMQLKAISLVVVGLILAALSFATIQSNRLDRAETEPAPIAADAGVEACTSCH